MPKKLNQKLVLKKETVDNLNDNSMQELKGGLFLTNVNCNRTKCKYPTLRALDCPETTPATYTCGEYSCYCLSLWPAV